MDGNRRWAKNKMLPSKIGHQKGAENIEKICEFLHHKNVKFATFYAFSTENWKRGDDQVNELFDLMRKYIKNDLKKMENDSRFSLNIIGDLDGLPVDIGNDLKKIRDNFLPIEGRLNITFAINYGSKNEISRAVKSLISSELKNVCFEDFLDTKNLPCVDLIIRTGGEYRLSNFLLLQSSYAELCFKDELWPDFSTNDLNEILESFKKCERNFGV